MAEDTKVEGLAGEKLDAIMNHLTGLHEKIDAMHAVTTEHGKRLDGMTSEFDSLRKRADAADEDEEERKDAAEEEREEEEREDARRKADAKHRADGESEEDRKERKDAEEREDAKRRADARARRDAKRPDESVEKRDARHAREDARYAARTDARRRKDAEREEEREIRDSIREDGSEEEKKALEEHEAAERADAKKKGKLEGFMEGGEFHPIRSSPGYKKSRADAKARKDATMNSATAEELAAVKAELALLKGRLPATFAREEDKQRFVEAQSFADSAYQAVFSEQAPYAQNGESLEDYRVRLMTKLKPGSRTFKDSNLSILVKDSSFHEVEKAIVAEAIDASRSNLQLGAPLRKEVKRLPSGHTETRYYGDSAVTWAPFSGGGVQFVRFNRALADAAAARDSARR